MCELHDEQLPLVMADTFTGEPGLSAPVYEVDFAPRKHRCDVLLVGSAHAPGGRPADAACPWACGSAPLDQELRRGRRPPSGTPGAGRHRRTRRRSPSSTMPISYDRRLRRRRPPPRGRGRTRRLHGQSGGPRVGTST
ncbi:MAG: DUF2169 domain-containing protein [Chromatiales bacterium]|nr:DUF2169 domain-containing protein [Chromatiales bacterium]